MLRPQEASMRRAVLLILVLGSLSNAAQPVTVGTMPPRALGSSHVYPGMQSYVSLANPAPKAATLTRVSIGWSRDCANAFKIVFLRNGYTSATSFTVVATRGPFTAVEDRNDITLSPPVTVAAGDLIGVVALQPQNVCGSPQSQPTTVPVGMVLVTNTDISTTGNIGSSALYAGDYQLALIGFGSEPVHVRTLPVVGSVQGASARFKTALQIMNTSPSPITGKFVFHPQGQSASPSDPSLAFTLSQNQTRSYDDVVASLNTTGLGSLDIFTNEAVPPVVVARIFSDGGSAGTSGFSQDAVAPHEAFGFFSAVSMPIPPDLTKFRMNIGVRTLDPGATIDVHTYDANGAIVFSRLAVPYGPNYFEQVPASTFTGVASLPPGGSIAVYMKNFGDRAFVYSSVIDNTTSDSTIRIAR
jgi:hypothetical protein